MEHGVIWLGYWLTIPGQAIALVVMCELLISLDGQIFTIFPPFATWSPLNIGELVLKIVCACGGKD